MTTSIINQLVLVVGILSCRIFLSDLVKELKYWAISNSSTDNVHRFFDSSPISPSNRFVAYTEFPFSPNSNPPNAATIGRIRVLNMKSRNNFAVEDSPIWGSQVGSHVQWGQSDSLLYYNSLSNHSHFHPEVSGIAFNVVSGERKILDCPIYHISPDGRWGICPNLSMIHRTQRGYGIDSETVRKSLKLNDEEISSSIADDGIYITDLKSGKCRLLVSLQKFIEAAGLSLVTPTFGFHTKWSSDGSRILCVIRTLENATTSSSSTGAWTFSRIWNELTKARSQVRVQHLFVVYINSSSSTSQCFPGQDIVHESEYKVQYILSWASQAFSFRQRQNSVPRMISIPDGNHPNWVANTNIISMNLEIQQKKKETTTLLRQWSVVVLDTDRMNSCTNRSRHNFVDTHTPHVIPLSLWRKYVNISQFGADNQFMPDLFSQVVNNGKIFKGRRHCELFAIEVFPLGTGHPHFNSGGRYLFLDAYAKERDLVVAHATAPHRGSLSPLLLPDKIPLKIVDILLQQEVWLMQVRLAVVGAGATQDRAWRCDMHPVLSLDGQWLAFNAREDFMDTIAGKENINNRQVYVTNVGKDLNKYFEVFLMKNNSITI